MGGADSSSMPGEDSIRLYEIGGSSTILARDGREKPTAIELMSEGGAISYRLAAEQRTGGVWREDLHQPGGMRPECGSGTANIKISASTMAQDDTSPKLQAQRLELLRSF